MPLPRRKKSRYQLTKENNELHERVSKLEYMVFGNNVPDPDFPPGHFMRMNASIPDQKKQLQETDSCTIDTLKALISYLGLKVKTHSNEIEIIKKKKRNV